MHIKGFVTSNKSWENQPFSNVRVKLHSINFQNKIMFISYTGTEEEGVDKVYPYIDFIYKSENPECPEIGVLKKGDKVNIELVKREIYIKEEHSSKILGGEVKQLIVQVDVSTDSIVSVRNLKELKYIGRKTKQKITSREAFNILTSHLLIEPTTSREKAIANGQLELFYELTKTALSNEFEPSLTD